MGIPGASRGCTRGCTRSPPGEIDERGLIRPNRMHGQCPSEHRVPERDLIWAFLSRRSTSFANAGVGKRTRFLPLVVASMLVGCVLSPQTYTDHDPSQDFSKYGTYAWLADDPLMNPTTEGDLLSAADRQRILNAIESELSAKGFEKACSRESASFTVAFTVGLRERLNVYSYKDPYSHNSSWGPTEFGSDVGVSPYTEGTLAIDIFDGTSKRMTWHGRMSRPITQEDVRHAAQVIPRAVASILRTFPPKAPNEAALHVLCFTGGG